MASLRNGESFREKYKTEYENVQAVWVDIEFIVGKLLQISKDFHHKRSFVRGLEGKKLPDKKNLPPNYNRKLHSAALGIRKKISKVLGESELMNSSHELILFFRTLLFEISPPPQRKIIQRNIRE